MSRRVAHVESSAIQALDARWQGSQRYVAPIAAIRGPASAFAMLTAILALVAAGGMSLPRPVRAAELPEAERPPSQQLRLQPPEFAIRLAPLGPDQLGGVTGRAKLVGRIGVTRAVPAGSVPQGPSPDGAWERTSGGTIWRAIVVSESASAVRLHFASLDLGRGELWIHDGAGQVHGPYSGAGPLGDGDFWTPLIYSDRVQVEYVPEFEPAPSAGAPFEILELAHIWRTPDGGGGAGPVGRPKPDPSDREPAPRQALAPKAWSKALRVRDGQGPRQVQPWDPAGFSLEADLDRTLFTGSASFQFEAHAGTESVEVRLTSVNSAADLDLYVRFGLDNEVKNGAAVADHWSDGPGGSEVLVIDRNSEPPLRSGRYFVSVGARTASRVAEGTVIVTPRYAPASCFTDLACYADAWDETASGIARIAFAADDGNHYQCSGALLSDARRTNTPYFLTAAHCIGSEAEARSMVAHWYFQNAVCSGRHEEGNQDTRYRTTSGATLLTAEKGSLAGESGINPYGKGDAALLRLAEPPPPGASLLGWDTSPAALAKGSNVVGIHHAEGLHKQVAYGKIVAHYRDMSRIEWGNGLTLGGASGSPLLDTSGRVIGIASGGRNDFDGCFSSGSGPVYSDFRSFYSKAGAFLGGAPVPSEPAPSPEAVVAGGRLTPGQPTFFRLPLETAGRLQNGRRSFTVTAPLDATRLVIAVEPAEASGNIDLYVRHGAGMESALQADWSSSGPSGREEIKVTRTTDPPLSAGTYYVSLRLHENATAGATGSLTATFERGSALPLDMRFVPIPAGEFVMGSDSEAAFFDESPLTRVRISEEFELGQFEVTQAQWLSVMDSNPAWHRDCGPDCPVEDVSWNDVQAFIAQLNALGDGYEYRLPTEAEWEYAARAGTRGDRYGPLDAIAWHSDNSGGLLGDPHPVGKKLPNAFGLHDMLGNVSEWVSDWKDRYSGGTVVDPTGPRTGYSRVVRGGSYSDREDDCRAPARSQSSQRYGWSDLGFRLARTRAESAALPPGGTLVSGQRASFGIQPSQRGVLQAGQRSYTVEVPGGSRWLEIELSDLSPGSEISLHVRHGRDNSTLQDAQWAATHEDGPLLLIGPFTDPPLRPGNYYISLLRSDTLGTQARGRLTASFSQEATPPGMGFAAIPPGTFRMGSNRAPSWRDEDPVTRVRLTRPFEMSRHEVTQSQWRAVMGSTPFSLNDDCGATCPVDNVSWNEVQEFLARLNSVSDGYEHRLPSEAEWEYAARSGSTGDRYGPLDAIAWHKANSGGLSADPRPVGQKLANAFGLYDMLGNVSELTLDWLGDYKGGTVTDPVGRSGGTYRGERGCNYRDSPEDCRVSARERTFPRWGSSGTGFRIARFSK